jgi:hypothetical protein
VLHDFPDDGQAQAKKFRNNIENVTEGIIIGISMQY